MKYWFFRFLPVLQFLCLLAIGLSHTAMAKVSATIILASVEGEVKALSLDEDLELTLDESSVGKSVDENFILTTGKNGKAVFLFSNGVLVSLKPNTRLYVRTFVQESFSAKNLPPPVELKEEPSTSHLKIHLDTGDLVVKAPKLQRGSSLKLTSPLGTAGILGTMFQIVVARDPDTGTVSGGVNLISGDIDFTDVSGDTSMLASGQGLEVSSGKLGESVGTDSGELRDLSAKFGPVLAGASPLPELIPPPDEEKIPPEGVKAPGTASLTPSFLASADGWGSIHDIATATFFEIEEAEFSIRAVTFDKIESSVSVDTPTPTLTAPAVPAAISGGDMAPPDPFFGSAPNLALKGKSEDKLEMGLPFPTEWRNDPKFGIAASDFSGGDLTSAAKLLDPPDTTKDGNYTLTYTVRDFRGFETTVNRKLEVVVTPPAITLKAVANGNDYTVPADTEKYPDLEDTDVFQSVLTQPGRNLIEFPNPPNYQDPGFSAHDYAFRDLTGEVTVRSDPSTLDISVLGSHKYVYTVTDLKTRGISRPNGIPVTTSVSRTVVVKDLTSPKIKLNPMGLFSGTEKVFLEGGVGVTYSDAGAIAIDNFEDDVPLSPSSEAVNMQVVGYEMDGEAYGSGPYSVLFEHSDKPGGNSVTETRYVHVLDLTPPVLTLFGQTFDFIDLNSTYRDQGVLAVDNVDGEIPWEPDPTKRTDPRIVVEVKRDGVEELVEDGLEGAISREELGKYLVTYKVYDNDAIANPSNSKRTNYYSEITRTIVVLGNDGGKTLRIELIGANPLEIEVGPDTTAYEDPGAKAFKDMGSGRPPEDYTDSISIDTSLVEIDKVGSYQVFFTVEDKLGNSPTDEFGNPLETTTRTVIVHDTTSPRIYPIDNDDQIVEAGVPYADRGAEVLDNYDLSISLTTDYRIKGADKLEFDEFKKDLAQVGFLDAGIPGANKQYEVVYGAKDDYNNSATNAERVITVKDTTVPSIEFLPSTVSSTFVFPDEASRTLQVIGDNAKVVFPNDPDFGWSNGENFVITKDSYDREVIVARGFRILNSETGVYFDDPGVRITDNARGSLSVTVEPQVSPVSTIPLYEYKITYKATDPAGNVSEVLERSIYLVSGPRITINGDSSIEIVNGKGGYEDDLAVVRSVFGEDITSDTLKVSLDFREPIVELLPFTNIFKDEIYANAIASLKSGVDLSKTGEYRISYDATDGNGNAAEKVTRTVYSIANTEGASTITFSLEREDPYSMGFGSQYVELGATALYERHKGKGDPYAKTFDYLFGESNDTGVVRVVSSNVNANLVNKYSGKDEPYVVTYQVRDDLGNVEETELAVYVRDVDPPSISPVTVNGIADLTIEAGQPFLDPGFYYSDNYWSSSSDFDANVTYVDKSKKEVRKEEFLASPYEDGTSISDDESKIETWDLEGFGIFTVHYELTDKSGNYRDYNRTVNVVDTTPPTLELVEESTISTLPVGFTTAEDLPKEVYSSDGWKTFQVVGDNGVEVVFPEEVIEIASVPDSKGRTQRRIGGFKVLDSSGQTIYTDPGVYLSDNAQGELSVTITNAQLSLLPEDDDSGISIKFRVTYEATDEVGNSATSVSRVLELADGPRIKLIGESVFEVLNHGDFATTGYIDDLATVSLLGEDITSSDTLKVSLSYREPTQTQYISIFSDVDHADAIDRLRGDRHLSWYVGGVDLSKVREYRILYNATDRNGNNGLDVTRTVFSIPDDGGESIIISPVKNDPYLMNYGISYVEEGATGQNTRWASLESPWKKFFSYPYGTDDNSSRGYVRLDSLIGDTNSPPTETVVSSKVNRYVGFDDPYTVRYVVSDEFGNEKRKSLDVYVMDKEDPVIVPVRDADNSIDTLIEAGTLYADFGLTYSDNYWQDPADFNVTVSFYDKFENEVRKIEYAGETSPYQEGDSIPADTDYSEMKTWDLTNFARFTVRYELTEKSWNYVDFNRTVTVVDTKAPTLTLLPDSSGKSETISILQHLPAQDLNSSYEEFGISVSDNSIDPTFYTTENPLSFLSSTLDDSDEASHPTGISVVIDDSSLNLEVPGDYEVIYTVTDSSKNESVTTRKVIVLDREKPIIAASATFRESPASATVETPYVLAEAGVEYTDASSQTVKLWNGSDTNSTVTLSLTAQDTQDGDLTNSVTRTIGTIDAGGSFTQIAKILNNEVGSVFNYVKTTPKTDNVLDTVYEIRYDVVDSSGNAADTIYRRIIVKDTLSPIIQQPGDGEATVTVDQKSTSDPNVNEVDDVKDFLKNGFTAVDSNSFDTDFTWNVDIAKQPADGGGGFAPGDLYPETRDGGVGYTVTITVQDSSGNTSDPVTRYLKVGDYDPPTLTMMGKAEIHDFFRFGKNSTGNQPLPNTHKDEMTGKHHDATGFSGGAHRMMLAEYNFTDPGVYAEDNNAEWDIDDGNPDLDGDGIGEGYATLRVPDRADMVTCENAGIIYVYSWFEEKSLDMRGWQALLAQGSFGYNSKLFEDLNASISPAKIPDVNGTFVGTGYDFNSSDKTNLTNFDVTFVTIEYRVKDGWGNHSSIMTRNVYIYESEQYGQYAFYATPITDAANNPFEDYDNNGTTGNPALSGARKDTDGDGVSDFWEFALGTNYKDVDETPNFSANSTFQNANLSSSTLQTNLSRMNAVDRLGNVGGINQFKNGDEFIFPEPSD